ncbi:MAG: ATP-binding protein, partial [Anaerolineae bacterium]|nr:ATP-binding protein [Anaerolineae bacterium]
MAFIEAPTNFYLGRMFDNRAQKLTDDVVYYDSRDLTTHAVVVGMTGSGKTGLCISLLEEAILDNIPAIIIDPKGDITNLALTFPELKPEEFRPWILDDDARRANMSPDQYAAHEAAKWRDGLARWDIVPDRLKWLKLATRLSIYTPGSDMGLPISILASLKAPRMDWNTQTELIRERINGVVTAIYALAGMNMRPVTDEPHVLMANIIEYNWRIGRDMTIEDIILQIQQPPFEKLGVFPVDQYISEKKRYGLAMELNSVIAAPSFASWIQGEPLDIQHLLYTPDGKPKVSVFYIAHLSDQERMFIMTLLLESMNAWMRMQSGTSSLRALLYVDEMFGYFPPYPKNPPTKDPIMRLLKQARAFGVGLILATQNPGDLDY